VSLCELFTVPEDPSAIASGLRSMKLAKAKAAKLRSGSGRYNSYVSAIEAWDGDPATEPVL